MLKKDFKAHVCFLLAYDLVLFLQEISRNGLWRHPENTTYQHKFLQESVFCLEAWSLRKYAILCQNPVVMCLRGPNGKLIHPQLNFFLKKPEY